MSSPQPSSATNALRISRPSAVRTGMFCRFGRLARDAAGGGGDLVERGVDAAVGADQRRERVGVGAAQLLDLAVAQQVFDDRVLRRAIFWSESASVDGPVFVFFTGVSPSFSNRIVRSCGVELTLNSSPACAWISRRGRRTASPSSARSSSRNSRSMRMPADLHLRQHPHERALEALVEVE